MNAHLGKPLDLDNVIATSVPLTAARSKVLKKAVFTEALTAIVQKRSGSFGRCGWLESSRVYLKTPNVTGSEEFLRCARHFFAGILTYFKEK